MRVLLLSLLIIFSVQAQVLQKVVSLKSAPVYQIPDSHALPISYTSKGVEAELSAVETDSNGTAWFYVMIGADTVYSPASYWQYVPGTVDTAVTATALTEDNADRKRRLMVLRDHLDWPRRIIRAVRDGSICLGMTPSQVEASWGVPQEKIISFIIGFGECDMWLYPSSSKGTRVIIFKALAVAGWSKTE
jgi:hypothetical protein